MSQFDKSKFTRAYYTAEVGENSIVRGWLNTCYPAEKNTKMKRNLSPLVTVLSLAAVCIAQPSLTPKSSTNQDTSETIETISVKDFASNKVIGHLGHPLGTIVRVSGMTLDGDATGMKADIGNTLLEIQTVNGQELETPVTFTFNRAAKGIHKPAPGDAFDYYVHESGVFDGVVVPPRDLGIEHIPMAHDGFHYRRQISIHKSLQ